MAKYIYDAWGNCTISGETTNNALAHANPIRYRGYYYDDDTGLYYLNSRYYSPKWRRFISPATSTINPSVVNGLNVYVYAGNNPVAVEGYSANTHNYSLHTDVKGVALGTTRASKKILWPTVPEWLRNISKVNDVFSAASHSFVVGKYLFANLSFIDEMRMWGINPATALGKLPQALYLKRISKAFSLLDAGIAFYENLQQGNPLVEAALDGALTFGKSALSAWVGGTVGANVGGFVGAGLGSLIPIPGVGTFVGFVVGTAAGVISAWFVDDVLGLIKDELLDWIFD